MKIKKWKKRTWLNPLASGDNGYLITGQETDEEGFLKLADCNRIISLNLWFDTKKDKAEVVKKLGILIDDITVLRDKLLEVDV
jgi:hypothetical protein